jgi:hypothetical protein
VAELHKLLLYLVGGEQWQWYLQQRQNAISATGVT